MNVGRPNLYADQIDSEIKTALASSLCHSASVTGGVFGVPHFEFLRKPRGSREAAQWSGNCQNTVSAVRQRLKKTFNGFPKVARCLGIGHGSAPVPEIHVSALSLGFGNTVFWGPLLFARLCPTKTHFSVQDRDPASHRWLRLRERCQGALKKTQRPGHDLG